MWPPEKHSLWLLCSGFSIVVESDVAASPHAPSLDRVIPSGESSRLKWHVWWRMLQCWVVWAYALSGKTSLSKNPFHFINERNDWIFTLFMPPRAAPLTFLSTWVTIYSHIRVGDFTLLQEGWFYSMSAGFSITLPPCVCLHHFMCCGLEGALQTTVYCICKKGQENSEIHQLFFFVSLVCGAT